MDFLKEIIEIYDKLDFELSADSGKQVTVVQRVTDLLLSHGYDPTNGVIQNVAGINIYPPDYFNPQDFVTGFITLTDNTRTIHHFAESWKPSIERRLHNLSIRLGRKYGSAGRKIAYIFGLPYWIYKKLKNAGLSGALRTIKKKIKR